MSRGSVLGAVAAALALTVVPIGPARSAGPQAPSQQTHCMFTSTISLTPGLSVVPSSGTFSSGGETGTVQSADADGLSVVWDAPHGAGDGDLADAFPAAQVRALRHAWALTVAEAQGGRWPAVVAVFDGDSAPKLTRALALGAITLATQHLTVVHGAGRALAEAVEKIPDRARRTRLKHALRD